jgi:hypothetical protein
VIDPEDLVAELVALLQAIPELVTAMGEDATRIYGHADQYPQNVNLARAVHGALSPSVMVAYRGFGPGSMGAGQPIKHAITLYVRPGINGSCSAIGKLLIDGVPAGQPLPMVSATVDDDLDPMFLEGNYESQEDAEGVEYWQLNISFNQKWG